jgi:hypothetical protein
VCTKDSCWYVGMVYGPRGLPGVSIAGPRVAQDNVVLNASQGENELGGDSRNKSESGLSQEVIPIKKKKVEMQQEIRISEILKKDMGIRIEENNRRMVVKRNLEGNAQKN